MLWLHTTGWRAFRAEQGPRVADKMPMRLRRAASALASRPKRQLFHAYTGPRHRGYRPLPLLAVANL